MMQCMHCGTPSGGEHPVNCPLFEPPLTQREIRSLRALMRANGYGAPFAVTPNPETC
jgi:hypothetical protein